MKASKTLAGLALLLVLGSAAVSAAAAPRRTNTKARAETLLREAQEHFRAGRFDAAARAFEESYTLAPDPLIQFNLGRAYEQLGRYNDATRALERCLQSNPPSDLARRARDNLDYLRSRGGRGRLAVLVDMDGADISIDGRSVGRSPLDPLELSPGRHTVRIGKAGLPPAQRDIEVVKDAEVVMQVSLAKGTILVPSEGSTTSTRIEGAGVVNDNSGEPVFVQEESSRGRIHPAAWIMLGSGAALTIVGGVLVGVAEMERDDVRAATGKVGPDGRLQTSMTRQSAVEKRDRANSEMTAGVVLMSIGGAALVGSIPLFFMRRGGGEAPDVDGEEPDRGWQDSSWSAVPVQGGGMLTVSGRF